MFSRCTSGDGGHCNPKRCSGRKLVKARRRLSPAGTRRVSKEDEALVRSAGLAVIDWCVNEKIINGYALHSVCIIRRSHSHEVCRSISFHFITNNMCFFRVVVVHSSWNRIDEVPFHKTVSSAPRPCTYTSLSLSYAFHLSLFVFATTCVWMDVIRRLT